MRKLYEAIRSFLDRAQNALGNWIADLFVFGGLGLLGHGLWLYSPKLSYTVVGLFLMAFGFLMGRK